MTIYTRVDTSTLVGTEVWNQTRVNASTHNLRTGGDILVSNTAAIQTRFNTATSLSVTFTQVGTFGTAGSYILITETTSSSYFTEWISIIDVSSNITQFWFVQLIVYSSGMNVRMPVYSPIAHIIYETNFSTGCQFRYIAQVYVYDSNFSYSGFLISPTLVATMKLFPDPDGLGVFDIHRVVENYVTSTVNLFNAGTSTAKDSYVWYRVDFGVEWNTTCALNNPVLEYDAITSFTGLAWNGALQYEFPTNTFDESIFQMGDDTKRFLTDHPSSGIKIKDDGNYQLYLLNFYNAGKAISATVDAHHFDGSTTTSYPFVVEPGYPDRAGSDLISIGVGPSNLNVEVNNTITPTVDYYDTYLTTSDTSFSFTVTGNSFAPPPIISLTIHTLPTDTVYHPGPISVVSGNNTTIATEIAAAINFQTPLTATSSGPTVTVYGSYAMDGITYTIAPGTHITISGSTGAFTTVGLPTQVSEKKRFYIDRECTKYDHITLTWLNRWGGFDAYTFIGKSTRTVPIKRTEYTRGIGQVFSSGSTKTWGWQLGGTNGGDRGRTTLSVLAADHFKLSTGNMTEDEAVWIEQLFTSPQVVIQYQTGEFNDDFNDDFNIGDTFTMPVTVVSASYEEQTRAKQHYITYTIEVQAAWDKSIQRA